MRLIVASHNQDKTREIRAILSGTGLEVVDLAALGFHEAIEENGSGFAENACIKAGAIAARFPNDVVMADDSGLCIDCLDGAPGVFSARFMGEETPYAVKNQALIAAVDAKAPAPRSARFVCAICCVLPGGERFTVEGRFEGEIASAIRGAHGFGYDPIFFLPERGLTSAELEPEEKNRISHRGQALRMMLEELLRRRVGAEDPA